MRVKHLDYDINADLIDIGLKKYLNDFGIVKLTERPNLQHLKDSLSTFAQNDRHSCVKNSEAPRVFQVSFVRPG